MIWSQPWYPSARQKTWTPQRCCSSWPLSIVGSAGPKEPEVPPTPAPAPEPAPARLPRALEAASHRSWGFEWPFSSIFPSEMAMNEGGILSSAIFSDTSSIEIHSATFDMSPSPALHEAVSELLQRLDNDLQRGRHFPKMSSVEPPVSR